MKSMILIGSCVSLLLVGCGEYDSAESDTATETTAVPTTPAPAESKPAEVAFVSLTDQRVEVACGMCIFDAGADRCELALKVDGVAYRMAGDGVDAHAHTFCGGSGTAVVSGETKDGFFHATKLAVD